MKISQIQGVPINQAPPSTPQQYSVDIAVGLIAGCLGAFGVPKLVQMFASDRVDSARADRRRDDIVLESVLKVNETMLKASADNYLKMMEFTQTLASEISMMREVISNNTNVMERVRIAGEELKDEMRHIKVQISQSHSNDVT